ncbi:MAG: hypothetical protein VX939_01585 [Pseudomonadota bacterium]|nr:hypothetical protein [Pseudomonadota bacterium]
MSLIPTRHWAFVPVLVSLAACGGSENDGRTVRDEPLTLDPAGYANQPAVIRSLADIESVDRTYADMAAVYRVLEEAEVALVALAEAPPADPDDPDSDLPPGDCNEANDNLMIQRTELADGGFVAQYDFGDCRLEVASGELQLSGFVQLERRVNGGSVQISESYGLSGTVFPGGAELGLSGSLSATVSASSENSLSVSLNTRALEFLYGNRYAAFRDAQINLLQTGDVVSLDVSAQLIGSFLQGYLSLATSETVQGDATGACPDRGHLSIEGEGTLDVRFGASTARGTGSELLVNGSEVEFSDTCPSVLPAPSVSLLFLIGE